MKINTYEIETKPIIADLHLSDLYNCQVKARTPQEAKQIFINDMKKEFNIIIYKNELFVK